MPNTEAKDRIGRRFLSHPARSPAAAATGCLGRELGAFLENGSRGMLSAGGLIHIDGKAHHPQFELLQPAPPANLEILHPGAIRIQIRCVDN